MASTYLLGAGLQWRPKSVPWFPDFHWASAAFSGFLEGRGNLDFEGCHQLQLENVTNNNSCPIPNLP
jgi:hypothetical protein